MSRPGPNACFACIALKDCGCTRIWVVIGNELGHAEFLLNPIECLLMVGLLAKMVVLLGFLS